MDKNIILVTGGSGLVGSAIKHLIYNFDILFSYQCKGMLMGSFFTVRQYQHTNICCKVDFSREAWEYLKIRFSKCVHCAITSKDQLYAMKKEYHDLSIICK